LTLFVRIVSFYGPILSAYKLITILVLKRTGWSDSSEINQIFVRTTIDKTFRHKTGRIKGHYWMNIDHNNFLKMCLNQNHLWPTTMA